jgi:hypothetical protein
MDKKKIQEKARDVAKCFSYLMKECGFSSVSDFIRAAALDDEIKVVTEVYQEPIRKDYTVLITATLGNRMNELI